MGQYGNTDKLFAAVKKEMKTHGFCGFAQNLCIEMENATIYAEAKKMYAEKGKQATLTHFGSAGAKV